MRRWRLVVAGTVAAIAVTTGVGAAGGLTTLYQIMFKQTGTSAVARTARSKVADFVSVMDFGATGNGVTNDTAAVTAAITYAGSFVNVYFPCPGTYQTTTWGTIPCGYETLVASTGAVPRPLGTKIAEFLSAKDFGAVGNGVTDDTAAIGNLLNAAASTQLINLPCPGTYVTSTYGTLSCGMYYPPLTGGVPRAVAPKLLDTVSVKDFGALGDGVTDDSTAIASARTAAGPTGTVLFPCPGTYHTPSGDYVCGTEFGKNPAIDSSVWRRSAYRIGLSDATNGVDLFGFTSHIEVTAVTGASNFEKGAAFFRALDNDTSSTATNRAVIGFDSLAEIAGSNTNGQIWGGVIRYQVDSTGDGSAYGLEVDGTNNGTGVNDHGDSGLKTKIPIWLASAGSAASSWMFDSAAGGPGFYNGIGVRNIVAGGMGIELPNNIGAYWRKADNTADVRGVIIDSSNNLVLGGTNNLGIYFQVGGSGVGNNTGTGWTNMTLLTPGISDAVMTSTKNAGQCTLNGASPAVCTATVVSGAHCTANPNGTTAAAALHTVATSVTTTTLTVTGANGLTDVINYHCF